VGKILPVLGVKILWLQWHTTKQMTLIDNETLSGVKYLRAAGVQSPFYLERDGQERVVFVCNYQTQRVLT